jgi:hypothetical protein
MIRMFVKASSNNFFDHLRRSGEACAQHIQQLNAAHTTAKLRIDFTNPPVWGKLSASTSVRTKNEIQKTYVSNESRRDSLILHPSAFES